MAKCVVKSEKLSEFRIYEGDYLQSNAFEKAFADFVDRREYDQAENALFAMVRISFLAGWRAAGGQAPPPQKVLELVHKENIDPSAIETDLE